MLLTTRSSETPSSAGIHLLSVTVGRQLLGKARLLLQLLLGLRVACLSLGSLGMLLMTEAPIGVGSEMSQKITFLSESLLTVSLSANEWSLTSLNHDFIGQFWKKLSFQQ